MIETNWTVVGVLATTLTAPFVLAQKPVETGNQQFQGIWKIVAAEIDGKKVPKERLGRIDVTINQNGQRPMTTQHILSVGIVEGDRVTIGTADAATRKEAEFTLHGRYKLSRIKGEFAVDVTIGGQHTYRGVYRLEGDTLTLCYGSHPGRERPTSFETRSGDLCVLVVLKKGLPR